MKKLLSLLLIVVLAVPLISCGNKDDGGGALSYSDMIENVRTVSKLTGKDALTDTASAYLVGGTDLGIPIYNSVTDEMYLAFGDTFLDCIEMSGVWRSNVLAASKDFNLSDGLSIDSFLANPTGVAKAFIEGHHNESNKNEITKIPTGGVEVDGIIYIFYMSVKEWTVPGEWTINYNGVVKSEDNCKTFTRVADLSWLAKRQSDGEKEATMELVNQNVSLKSEYNISAEGRYTDNFLQICPVDGGDGYVYLIGIGNGRNGGAKLGRVLKKNIENFDEYEYFVGNSEGIPTFIKGGEGLKAAEADSAYILPPAVGEPSVMFNKHLNKWIMTYYADNSIVMRAADKLYGEWSQEQTIITNQEYLTLYGGFVHQKYTSDNGKKFYMTLSQWKPVYNTFVIEVELK